MVSVFEMKNEMKRGIHTGGLQELVVAWYLQLSGQNIGSSELRP